MNSFYPAAKKAGMLLIMMGFFLFLLQGCTTPLIKVEVVIDECCKKGEECKPPASGCPSLAIPTQAPAGPHDGIQCDSGAICANEGALCNWGMVCDTQRDTSGGSNKCLCKCTAKPD